jgi:sec-independent protein translocase protein TatA
MPFGLGWPELTIILVIVLIVFGASRVPEVGGAIGRGIKEFKKSLTQDDSIPDEPVKPTKAASRRAPKKK